MGGFKKRAYRWAGGGGGVRGDEETLRILCCIIETYLKWLEATFCRLKKLTKAFFRGMLIGVALAGCVAVLVWMKMYMGGGRIGGF